MELRNRRVVVTGGAGFIGSHVVDALIAAENEVIVIDNFSTGKRENIAHHANCGLLSIHEADIRDPDAMVDLLRGADIVIHMAVACLRVSIHNPQLVHDVNATGTLNVCRAALKNSVGRFVYISSSEAYGTALTAPMTEEHPLRPTTVYGASKASGELYALAHWRTYGLPTVVVRPFNCYGAREHSEGASAEVIPKFVMRVMSGLRPVIFGDGRQTRDFTWVDDTARGIVLAGACDALVGDCVNIARGQEVSIREICRIVLETLHCPDMEPEFVDNGRPGDISRHFADSSKARNLLGFTAEVGIAEGIGRYVAWVREQNPNLKGWLAQERVVNW